MPRLGSDRKIGGLSLGSSPLLPAYLADCFFPYPRVAQSMTDSQVGALPCCSTTDLHSELDVSNHRRDMQQLEVKPRRHVVWVLHVNHPYDGYEIQPVRILDLVH